MRRQTIRAALVGLTAAATLAGLGAVAAPATAGGSDRSGGSPRFLEPDELPPTPRPPGRPGR
ncbi:hypothetical protein NKH77_54445 [Streptomyces sp. M19]